MAPGLQHSGVTMSGWDWLGQQTHSHKEDHNWHQSVGAAGSPEYATSPKTAQFQCKLEDKLQGNLCGRCIR